ncbi:DUF4179 domain-containing protein [Paenibacillus alvei]|uniref:DUF4179 domain-containing protein n=1 Tax=Paenibacillus alvei TaxID=44250 RepID=UPI0013DA152A|nr:DUF4179 domain-containing protein [Paenibacillus alvei]NEZ41745.1 hypothetical protein [Paenibacillus alvei]
MLKLDRGTPLKKDLQHSLDELPVPSSLLQFVKEVPSMVEDVRHAGVSATRRKRRRFIYKAAAIGAILAVTSLSAIQVSPSFAELVKNIPGFSLAKSVMEQLFDHGSDNAKSHGYEPFKPVVQQFDDMKISISDLYLTGDRLTFRSMITSDNIKQNVITRKDGMKFLDRTANLYDVKAVDFEVLKSVSGGIYIDAKTKEPFLMSTATSELKPDQVQQFLSTNPRELRFEVNVNEYKDGSFRKKASYKLSIPFDSSKLLKDKIIPLHKLINISGDPDLKDIILGDVTITPTNTYLNVSLDKKSNYYLRFIGNRQDSYLEDDKGRKYPLFSDDTIGAYQIEPVGEDGNRLSFYSSPYFEDAERLTLHIKEVSLTEKVPGEAFTFTPGEQLPKTVTYKGKKLTITDAYYDDVYLMLKIKKDASDPDRTGIRFAVSPSVSALGLDRNGGIDVGEVRVIHNQKDYYQARIHAPKLESYKIEMSRESSPVTINSDIEIDLK